MPDETVIPNQLICQRDALINGGKAILFELTGTDLQNQRKKVNCFTVAYEDNVYAYQNVCPHLGTPLDWQPGEVFDETGLYLICATHGAVFEPETGLCTGGPCRGGRLSRIPIVVENDRVMLQDSALSVVSF